MKRQIAAMLFLLLMIMAVGCSENIGTEPTVPPLEGLNKDEAVKQLEDAGYAVETVYVEDDSVPEDTVIRSDSVANGKTPDQPPVKLFISSGSNTCVCVPNLIGMSKDEAISALNSVGLQVSSDIKYKTNDKAKDTVILCSPLPGSSVPSGSSVQLVLSSGEKKEKAISITVDLPAHPREVKLEVYVDGVLDSSKSTTVDTQYKTEETFTFTGMHGTIDVRIKLNDQPYKRCEINFDNNAFSVFDD